ncbi:MAG: hypothetical protein U1E54_05010, partial [Candidatus Levybacteria bacterium]|nr:hypothetical protein [Candidatus Levybacteria bacterium]
MDGFRKIDLENVSFQSSEPKIINNRPKSKAKIALSKKTVILIGIIIVVLFIFGLTLISPVQKLYSD